MRHNALALALALAACSDYELHQPTDDGPPPDAPVDESVEECLDGDTPLAFAVTPDESCLAEPAVGTFHPVIEWQWSSNPLLPGYDQVMSTPVVGNLTDDNGDGRIDENDVPDLAFTSYAGSAYGSNGTLNVISGDGSGMHWTLTSAGGHTWLGSAGVALGDLEGDGVPEVCVAGTTAAVICLSGPSGELKWAAGSEIGTYSFPSIADMDGNGTAEVILGRQIFNFRGQTVGVGEHGVGSLYGASGYGGASFAVDMDDDGQLEVVAGNAVYERDGSTLWYDGGPDGAPAVGDFDGDGLPEVVRVGDGLVRLVDTDGTATWTTAIPGSGNGGPPTVADFDGDGAPEVGVANLSYYSMIDTDGTVMWSNPTEDDSSSVTGSSVFDFEGDGVAEVVYADEHTLYVYAGPTGEILLQDGGHASGTLWEYPVIADVDDDGSAEIIVPSNNMWWEGWTGITVIGDADSSWAPARPVWNQHAYHITNVNNDLTIPTEQAPNWARWNNFRAGGTELGPADWQPDLRLDSAQLCPDECLSGRVTVYVPVSNHGLLDAADVTVEILATGDGPDRRVRSFAVGTVASGDGLVAGPIVLTDDDWGADSLTLRVLGSGRECDESNNERSLGTWPCE